MGITTVLCLHDQFPMPWCFKDRQGAVLLPLGQGWVGIGVGKTWNLRESHRCGLGFQGKLGCHFKNDSFDGGFSVNEEDGENGRIHDDGEKMIQVKIRRTIRESGKPIRMHDEMMDFLGPTPALRHCCACAGWS